MDTMYSGRQSGLEGKLIITVTLAKTEFSLFNRKQMVHGTPDQE
jgi:hypothetical protein